MIAGLTGRGALGAGAGQPLQVLAGLGGGPGLVTPWTPLELEPRLALRVPDEATLFQDTAGLMPATQDFDPIARITDVSASGLLTEQAIGGHAPVLLRDAGGPGMHMARFDGVDDHWDSKLIDPGGSGQHTILAILSVPTNNLGVYVLDTSTAHSVLVRGGAGQIECYVGPISYSGIYLTKNQPTAIIWRLGWGASTPGHTRYGKLGGASYDFNHSRFLVGSSAVIGNIRSSVPNGSKSMSLGELYHWDRALGPEEEADLLDYATIAWGHTI